MDKTYTVNTNKKVITISNSAKLTATDKEEITMYLNVGYVLRHKSAARAKKAAERADTLKDADIKEALKDDANALKTYNDIKKDKGFFAAKKWYKEKCNEEAAKKED